MHGAVKFIGALIVKMLNKNYYFKINKFFYKIFFLWLNLKVYFLYELEPEPEPEPEPDSEPEPEPEPAKEIPGAGAGKKRTGSATLLSATTVY